MFSTDLLIVLVVFLVSVILLISNRIRYDIIGIGAVFVLLVFGITKLSTVTLEIGSLPVLLLGIVMIVSKTISDSGIIDKFADILSKKIRNEKILLLVLFLLVGVLSGFMSDVALTLMMIPLGYFIAEKQKKSPSKYLLPFAYMAVLGGRYTVASTSSNVILYDLWYSKTGHFLPFFQFAEPGIFIILAGIPVAILISYLIPNTSKKVTSIDEFKTGEYLTEVKVENESPIVGHSINDFEKEYGIRIVAIYPGRISWRERTIFGGDVIMVRLKPEAITTLSGIKGIKMTIPKDNAENLTVREVFVMPESRLIGQQLIQIREAGRYNISVIGISAYGKKIFGRFRTITVEAGDVLLLSGSDEDVASFISDNALGPLSEREMRVFNLGHGVTSILALAIAVILASFGVNLIIAFGSALLIMLATRSLNFKLMYRHVQWPILIFVGTYLILGAAIISTGLSGYIASFVLDSPLVLFLLTVILANTVGNVGSAVIMGPIALGFPDPLKAIVVVAMAASSTFVTSFGNQSNLIVQGAGSYTAKDYALYGSILVVLSMVITMLYAYL